MTFRMISTCVAALLLSAGLASAQGLDEKVVEMDLQVTEMVDHMLGDGFDATHRNLLKSAAHQMSVAQNCAGFSVDNEKAGLLLAKVVEGHSEEDEDYESVQSAVLMSLGAFLAAGQALHALDEEGFCAHAEQERDGGEAGSDHIIWAAAN